MRNRIQTRFSLAHATVALLALLPFAAQCQSAGARDAPRGSRLEAYEKARELKEADSQLEQDRTVVQKRRTQRTHAELLANGYIVQCEAARSRIDGGIFLAGRYHYFTRFDPGNSSIRVPKYHYDAQGAAWDISEPFNYVLKGSYADITDLKQEFHIERGLMVTESTKRACSRLSGDRSAF